MKTNPVNDPTVTKDAIAVVGLGCLFPGSQDRHGFWAGLRGGTDNVEQVPEGYWTPEDYHDPDKGSPDRTYGNRGAFISPTPFHPLDYGITPRDLEATDTSQLLGLVAARQALEDAGYDAQKTFDREKASVILGVTGALELVIPLGARLGHPLWWKALRESGVQDEVASEVVRKISEGYVDWQENSFPGLLGNVVAGRIANRLDLHGTNCVTDAACASSLAALHLAALELKSGRSDMVVTGGVDTFNDIFMYMCFSKTPALSPTGDARPFDAEGDGTVLGEGLGVVVLKRWEDAERDGDRIYAKILSIGTSSDGKGAAIYAPTAPGQQRALRDAYQLAGVSPDTIGLVEAHGTGTSVGDATELKALDEVYRLAGARPGSVALGSVKSQIGHTKAAAGAAGLLKAVMALHHKVQPPSLKIRRPLDALADSQSPFHVEEVARPWVRLPDQPRRAAVSSFGFGGSNFHAVLEENQASRLEADWHGICEIFAFSADAKESLAQSIKDCQQRLKSSSIESEIMTVARETRQSFRSTALHRLLITVHSNANPSDLFDQAIQQLDREQEQSWSLPAGIERDHGAPRGSLAVVFPGQGSQRVDMGRNIACRFPAMMETLDQAEASFWNPTTDSGLADQIWPTRSWSRTREEQDTALRKTEIAQPAIGAISLGMYRFLEKLGIRGDMFAGHSYGELTALAASERISSSDFHQLSNFRGRLMAEAGGMDAGTMLAVQLPLEELEKLVRENWPDLVIANRNAPEQAVLSGGSDSIEAARILLEKRAIRCTPLPVAAAFHSTKVASAAQPFEEVLQKVRFEQTSKPVFANSTGQPYPTSEATCRTLLAHQIAKPVRFKEMIESMLQQGATTFLEVGPGKILSGLIQSIASSTRANIRVQSTDGDDSDARMLARSIALLAARGYPVQLTAWKPRLVQDSVERKGPVVMLRGANLKPGEGLPAKDPRPVPTRPAHLPPSQPTRETDPITIQGSLTPSHEEAQPHSLESVSHESRDQLLDHQEALMDSIEKALEMRENLDRTQRAAEEALARSLEGHPQRSYSEVESEPQPSLKSTASAGAESSTENASPPVLDSAMDAKEEVEPLIQFMAEIVAEKTGYPVSAIDPKMDLEADLGIDSIKRVEILSAMRQQKPELPALAPEVLGSLRTLEALVDYFLQQNPEVIASPSVGLSAEEVVATHRAPTAPTPSPAIDPPSEANTDSELESLLIQVVADKTGYPESAIDLQLDLEADLGIDSIKRVEILSALRQHRPDLEALPAETLGSLRTISSIVQHYSQSSSRNLQSSSDRVITTPAPTIEDQRPVDLIQSDPVSNSVTEDASILESLLIKIIADKTGYPQEAIGTDLDLEADLGIDSIKRVEILSALRQEEESLPTLPPEQLGSLRTIVQLVAALGSPSGNQERAPQPVSTNELPDENPQAAVSEISDSSAGELVQLLLEVISEKTGYPQEAIGIDLDLEADLGIDSIKRVEILSALRQHRPHLSAIPAEKLGTLRTISEIAGWYESPVSKGNQKPDPITEVPNDHSLVPPREALAQPMPEAPPLILATPATHSLPDRDFSKERILDKEAEWWIVGSDPLLRQKIADELDQRGVTSRHWNLKDLENVPATSAHISGLILIGSMEPEESEPLDLFRWLRGGGKRLRHQLQANPQLQANASVHFVTRLGGKWGCNGDSVADSLGGALLGLARCAAREWNDLIVRGIDLENVDFDATSVAHDLVSEIFHGDEPFVGLTSTGRLGWGLNPISTPVTAPTPLNPGDLVIVTGGARGVTAECLEALTRESSPALYLLGRTPEPGREPDWARGVADESLETRLFELATGSRSPAQIRHEANQIRQSREIQNRIKGLEAKGCQVTYRSVDVRQLSELSKVLDEARERHGEVRGIIHGAGVLADGWILEKSDEDFRKVWETKVQTARHLLSLCNADQLRLIQFFSSTTATLGRKGQSDYAAANETLNLMAHSEAMKRPGCHVASIGWGPWDGGMVEAGLRDLFHSEGVGLIHMSLGASHFLKQTGSGQPVHHIALCAHGEQPDFLRSISTFVGPEPEKQNTPEPAPSIAPALQPITIEETQWELQLQLEISCESDPSLKDHVLQGRAVIPAAVLIEWCAQVAAHRNPGLDILGVENFRILKGIVIGAKEIAHLSFFCAPPERRDGLLYVPVEVRSTGPETRLHVRTEILLGDRQPATSRVQRFTTAPSHDYSQTLFHGDSFRCISKVIGLNNDGITFTATGTPPPGIGFRSPLLPFWLVDPLRLDAIFQGLIIWSDKAVGAPCLPCSISSLRIHGNARVGELETRVELERFGPSSASASAEVLNEQGEPLLTISGAEVVIDAALKVAFQQHELTEEAQT